MRTRISVVSHTPAPVKRLTAPVACHSRARAPGLVLAAGLGMRLRPITQNLPKPLVTVAGQSILGRVLDALEAAGVGRCVVNTHYLAEMIEVHLAHRRQPPTELSHESELLDTGGGVAQALPALGSRPFFVVNADILWC